MPLDDLGEKSDAVPELVRYGFPSQGWRLQPAACVARPFWPEAVRAGSPDHAVLVSSWLGWLSP